MLLQVPRRTALGGPPLIRLLTRLADLDVAESGQSLPDRLGHWLGWTDALALAGVLNAREPAALPPADDTDDARECARVRAALCKAIAEDGVYAAPPAGPGRAARPARHILPPDDYATYRQRYVALQRTMATALANLRSRLRVALAARASERARLAMTDAVMERVLGARESSLFAVVPVLLERRFVHLREAEQAALAQAQAEGRPAPVEPGSWLAAFRADMRDVLLAELDVRFLPVEGLLAALHDR